ncbi:hypothetical protein HOK51_03130 [Candidatus Woesearchaeota archaeon]|jgi:uncharacterized protein (UPF0332 family)|nr:hypothetical protein [Candidatus Woesearchaeota archaeon]MBT6518812.1 hypothetical protein [Candidatus Woesearchaeota archaeon]MBT7367951.1 hypothetical protein [Candidatus Woesearchaeota archaeon]
MLDDKKLKEVENRIKIYIADGIIKTKEAVEFTDFFLKHSTNFLNSAKAEYLLSTNKDASQKLGFLNYDGFIVVVNSGYYSMFHMARALLESKGIKIKTEHSVHSVTFDALVYFFYLNKKIEKKLIESFAESLEESAEIQGQQRAAEMMNDFLFEKRKRSTFTYSMGSEIVEAKAKTSLNRAIKFHEELKSFLINK